MALPKNIQQAKERRLGKDTNNSRQERVRALKQKQLTMIRNKDTARKIEKQIKENNYLGDLNTFKS